MNQLQVVLMSKYTLRKFESKYKSKNSKKIHLRAPVSTILVSVMIIFLMTVLPLGYSSSPSSQTVVQDLTNNRSTSIGIFGAYQILPTGIVAPADSEVGNCFTTPGTTSTLFTISDAEFNLNSAVGLPAKGQLEVIIYNAVGIVGPTCVPNTTITSIGISVGTTPSQISSTTTGSVTFRFELIPPEVVLQGGTTYAISVRLVGCSVCDTKNFWNLGTDSPSLVLSFRVGSESVTMSPLGNPLISSSFSSYFWNGNMFIPNMPLLGGGGSRPYEM